MNHPTRERSPRRTTGWLVGLLAVLVACLFWLRRTGSEMPAALEPTRAPLRETTDTPLAAPPLESDDRARAAEVEEPAAPIPTNRRAALLVIVSSDGGNPWQGAFELWLAHAPAVGRRSVLEGAYRSLAGPRAEIFDLAPGSYRGWARAPARRSAVFTVEIERDAEHAKVELTMIPAGDVLGRLVGHDGAALDGMRVGVLLARHEVDLARSGDDGHFRCASVPDGEYVLAVGPKDAPLYRTAPIRHAGTETDVGVITVGGLTEIAVFVLDPSGNPVAGARVWDGATGELFDLRSDGQGRCVARRVPADQVRVFVDHPEHGRANRPIRASEGGENKLEIRLPR